MRYPRANLEALRREVAAYVASLDDLYGHFCDSTLGFKANCQMVVQAQVHSARALPPGTDPDTVGMLIGRGDPNDPSNVLQHQTTLGEYKRRNAPGGRNHIRAAQLFLVLIYAFWDTGHRAQVAQALGLDDRYSLKVPLMGDLRLVRDDIIHHRGFVTKKTDTKLELLKQFKEGDEIVLDDPAVEALVRQVKAVLDSLVVDAGGIDPLYRTIWHVR